MFELPTSEIQLKLHSIEKSLILFVKQAFS